MDTAVTRKIKEGREQTLPLAQTELAEFTGYPVRITVDWSSFGDRLDALEVYAELGLKPILDAFRTWCAEESQRSALQGKIERVFLINVADPQKMGVGYRDGILACYGAFQIGARGAVREERILHVLAKYFAPLSPPKTKLAPVERPPVPSGNRSSRGHATSLSIGTGTSDLQIEKGAHLGLIRRPGTPPRNPVANVDVSQPGLYFAKNWPAAVGDFQCTQIFTPRDAIYGYAVLGHAWPPSGTLAIRFDLQIRHQNEMESHALQLPIDAIFRLEEDLNTFGFALALDPPASRPAKGDLVDAWLKLMKRRTPGLYQMRLSLVEPASIPTGDFTFDTR